MFCTRGLSASVTFCGVQLFGLFSFTIKEIHLVLHVEDSIKLYCAYLKSNP